MNVPKRHHFVPEMLQKRFVDEAGLLHFYNKRTPEKGVQSTRPGNLHVKTHLYSKILSDGTKDVALELRYAALEGVAEPIFAELVNAALRGRTPRIPSTTREVIDHFAYEQMRRVPEFHEQIMPTSDSERQIRLALDEYERRFRKVPAEQRENTLRPSSIEEFRQNARVGALSRHSPRVMRALASKSLVIARTRTKLSFMIGSRPVVRSRGNLPDPATEVWLPIGANVALLYIGERWESPPIYDVPDHTVRRLNDTIAAQSAMFAGRSGKLILSVIGRLVLATSNAMPRR
ncbi:DUF4238 domain-containing protein [Tardiphaga sp.]|jgi:hypothetical protein|uniref:DUF4238 domain-containing protein n=1 Tax=Tardiphaga sp. TaxID=1926292 RepID=UPI0037D9CBBE